MSTAAAPVYVIGGFLGSGKTTLLKRLLAHELDRGRRPAVLVNEFGSTDVDSRLLHEHKRSGDLELDALLNGCVCCDLSGELPAKLASLLKRAPRGPLFIETTGLASTDQVVDGVTSALASKDDAPRARLARVIVMVDVPRFALTEAAWSAARAHVGAADVVVLNKLDEAKPGQAALLERRVRAWNPRARVLRGSFARVPAGDLLKGARRSRGVAAAGGPKRDSTTGFVSLACKVLGPVDETRLRALLRRYRRSLHRLKGFVRISGRRGFHEVQ